MSSNSIDRNYTIIFNGRPTLDQVCRELIHAQKAVNPYTPLSISHNGSSDPDLEEVTFTLETKA